MLGIGGWDTVRESFTDMRVRSYFGVYTVTDDSYRHQRRLAHGTTLHGLQRPDAGPEYAPPTHNGIDSGVGLTLVGAARLAGANPASGIVGLGAGPFHSITQPGPRWTFFEFARAGDGLAGTPP